MLPAHGGIGAGLIDKVTREQDVKVMRERAASVPGDKHNRRRAQPVQRSRGGNLLGALRLELSDHGGRGNSKSDVREVTRAQIMEGLEGCCKNVMFSLNEVRSRAGFWAEERG